MESFVASLGGGSGCGGSKASFLQLPLPADPPPDARLGSPSPVGPLHQYNLLAGSSAAAQQQHSQLKEAAAVVHGHLKDGGGAVVQGEISLEAADASETVKAKIVSHPQYSALVAAYLDCQKVGAPPDVLDGLSEVAAKLESSAPAQGGRREHDPELDQFMEAYCNMLMKYRDELARPIQEATEFFKRVEAELDSITDSNCEGAGSSEDDQDTSCPEEIDPCAEDKELKHQLLRKYGGYLGSLRQEFSKRKKKGKLPKEARQKLLHWWELHYKWPYPSETEKMALADSTGLDQKQINNWFINQRKRHWKPAPEEIPFATMDGAFHVPEGGVPLYLDRAPFMVDGTYQLGS